MVIQAESQVLLAGADSLGMRIVFCSMVYASTACRVAVAALLLGAGAALAEPPPSGPPDYTRITGFHPDARLPLEQPQVLWKTTSETEDAVTGEINTVRLSDAVHADGFLYFGDERGALIAVRATDGSKVWDFDFGQRISVAPSVDADQVYFGSMGGIVAVRRRDGAVLWQTAIPKGAAECTPLPVGERLLASGYDGCAYCLDRRTGQVEWKHDFAADAPPDPPGFAGQRARFGDIVARPNGAACDGRLFIQSVFDQSRVIALDCETGERRWTFQAQGWISAAPTIAEGRVYVASQDKHLYCLDLDTGELLWKFATPSWNASQVAVHEGRVYLPHHGARTYQLAAEDGTLLGLFEPPDPADREKLTYTMPIIAQGTLYYTNGSGAILAMDIETRKLRWKLVASAGSELYTRPVTDGRRLFVTCRKDINDAGEAALIAVGIEP